jgi:hypothetical protein
MGRCAAHWWVKIAGLVPGLFRPGISTALHLLEGSRFHTGPISDAEDRSHARTFNRTVVFLGLFATFERAPLDALFLLPSIPVRAAPSVRVLSSPPLVLEAPDEHVPFVPAKECLAFAVRHFYAVTSCDNLVYSGGKLPPCFRVSSRRLARFTAGVKLSVARKTALSRESWWSNSLTPQTQHLLYERPFPICR